MNRDQNETKNDKAKLSQEHLQTLIAELGLHPQNGRDGIGNDLEKYYHEQYLAEKELREKYFDVEEDDFEETIECIQDKFKKNKIQQEKHWKYIVGRFKFN